MVLARYCPITAIFCLALYGNLIHKGRSVKVRDGHDDHKSRSDRDRDAHSDESAVLLLW